MDCDENLPLRGNDPLSLLVKQDLDPFSINELDDRITQLQAEITRCQAKKSAASSHMSAADQLFKKS